MIGTMIMSETVILIFHRSLGYVLNSKVFMQTSVTEL